MHGHKVTYTTFLSKAQIERVSLQDLNIRDREVKATITMDQANIKGITNKLQEIVDNLKNK